MKGQSLPEGVEVLSDLHYMHDGSDYHTLDIYYPSGTEGLLPIVVSVHGGAFVGGDKFYNKEFGMRLALYGYCVININYDLAPDVKLVEMVKCVNDALLWIYRSAEKYHGDINNVFGLGDSAGGWQVLTYSIVNKNEELRNKYQFLIKNPVNFKALALICPVANVKAAMGKGSRIKWFKKYVYKQGDINIKGKRARDLGMSSDLNLNIIRQAMLEMEPHMVMDLIAEIQSNKASVSRKYKDITKGTALYKLFTEGEDLDFTREQSRNTRNKSTVDRHLNNDKGSNFFNLTKLTDEYNKTVFDYLRLINGNILTNDDIEDSKLKISSNLYAVYYNDIFYALYKGDKEDGKNILKIEKMFNIQED